LTIINNHINNLETDPNSPNINIVPTNINPIAIESQNNNDVIINMIQEQQSQDIVVIENDINNATKISLEVNILCTFCENNTKKYKLKCGCYMCDLCINKKVFETKNIDNNNINNINNINQIGNAVDEKNPPISIINTCPKCNVEIIYIDDEENVCAICLENIDKNMLVNFHNYCSLKVCRECHYSCLKSSSICPYCRKGIY